jgi:Tfp pilus assembly protein PilV
MHHQFGVSLIEVLISFLLLSILLLGIDATHITALQKTKANYYFSVATQQMNIITNQLISKHNLDAWNQKNEIVLPQGKGIISDNKIIILWGGMSEENCKSNKIGTQGCLYQAI